MAQRIHYPPTPAPWKGIRRDKDGATLVIAKRPGSEDYDLALAEIHNASKADGELMVLAPAMLAALKTVTDEGSWGGMGPGGHHVRLVLLRSEWEEIKAVIEKAEGRA